MNCVQAQLCIVHELPRTGRCDSRIRPSVKKTRKRDLDVAPDFVFVRSACVCSPANNNGIYRGDLPCIGPAVFVDIVYFFIEIYLCSNGRNHVVDSDNVVPGNLESVYSGMCARLVASRPALVGIQPFRGGPAAQPRCRTLATRERPLRGRPCVFDRTFV